MIWCAADGVAEIGDEVAQVVFFLRADGAVGDHDAHVVARQRSDRVIGVDPRIHAFAGFELRRGGRSSTATHRRLAPQQRR